MRELRIKNDSIVRIAKFFDIQVIGKLAIYVSDTFGYKEEEVITDIAFLDTSGNTIVKRANLGLNLSIPYNNTLSEKLESICYFLTRKYDAINLENIMNNLIYNSMTSMNVRMHQEIRKEEEHNAKIAEVEKQIAAYKTLENELAENEILFFSIMEDTLYTLQFTTTEYKNKFLALEKDVEQMEILKNADAYDFISIGKTYNCSSKMYEGRWYYAGLKTA